MKSILKSISILLFFALPLSAQAKNNLPEAVKQIQQKVQKYRPTVNHKRSLTRAAEVTMDSIVNYFDDVAISKVYFTFDGEWYQTAYYNVSLTDDSLVMDKCEKVKVTDDSEEIINYFGYENEWYPLTRSVAYKEDGTDFVEYYSYKNDEWAIDTKYTVTVNVDEEGKTYTTEIVFYYDENGEVVDLTTWQRINIDGKLSTEISYGSYSDGDTKFTVIKNYNYDDNNRLMKVTYEDEFNQILLEEDYSYDDENWDFTRITIDEDSIVCDRYKEKAVGNELAYIYEKIAKGGELVMDDKVEVEITEDGSYVITQTNYDENGVETYTLRIEKSYDESGKLVLQEIYSSTDGTWVLSSRETREYMNDLLVKVTKQNGEDDLLRTSYYYYSDGTHTGIEKIAMPESQPVDGMQFDLQGRQINTTQRGTFMIKNGRVILNR